MNRPASLCPAVCIGLTNFEGQCAPLTADLFLPTNCRTCGGPAMGTGMDGQQPAQQFHPRSCRHCNETKDMQEGLTVVGYIDEATAMTTKTCTEAGLPSLVTKMRPTDWASSRPTVKRRGGWRLRLACWGRQVLASQVSKRLRRRRGALPSSLSSAVVEQMYPLGLFRAK